MKGLLVGLVQVDDLVKHALRYTNGPRGIDVALFDDSAPIDRQLLYYHLSRTRDQQDLASTGDAQREPVGIHHTGLLMFGGRRWALVCTPTPHFFATHANWRSWTILAIGLTVTCLSTAYTWSAATRTERIERLVRERTLELRKKDDQLRLSQDLKNREIRIAHEETIYRLVTASLWRDEETGMHIKRTGLLSELLARAASWSESQADTIRLAAPMHDVGKIGIPDAILRKPGKLTPAEFDTMKTHTVIGAKMLEGSRSAILAMARDIALCHHERWDGSGYPQGLSGPAIPEPARILSIIDVYDAMSHDRVYRPALAEDEVLNLMTRGAGTQFDPVLLAVFLAHYEAIRRLAQENPDESAAQHDGSAISSPSLANPPTWPAELSASGSPQMGNLGR
jgi:HD-GYP domain-containing protein (c-di-GMP phosphodiesterase class II)